jgi:hypothetical protein
MNYHPKSDFMRVMFERGFVADCTDYQALDEALVKGVVPAYIGYDATATSLHVGQPEHHDAALAAEDRGQADHPDGRRHDQDRRSVVPGGGTARC